MSDYKMNNNLNRMAYIEQAKVPETYDGLWRRVAIPCCLYVDVRDRPDLNRWLRNRFTIEDCGMEVDPGRGAVVWLGDDTPISIVDTIDIK